MNIFLLKVDQFIEKPDEKTAKFLLKIKNILGIVGCLFLKQLQ